MLLWALYPGNPYGYYILLRWICCGTLIFLTFEAMELEKMNYTWTLGITAVIYNPIIPVHLNREIWSIINIITIIILFSTIFFLKESKIENNN